MRTRTPIIGVALLLLLFGRAFPAAGQDAAPPPAERSAALQRLAAADREGRFEEAADLARACLAWLDDPRDRAAAASAAARALLRLGRSAECIKICDTFGPALVEVPEIRFALAAARADGPLTLDPDYRGKYAGDPRLAEARRRLDRTFPAAVDRVRRRLGLGDPGFPPIAVVFQDAATEDGTEITLMTASVVPRGAERVGIIVITTEPLVTGAWPEERILAHELTHILGQILGPVVMRPGWLEEGLAHWVSSVDTSELVEFTVGMQELWDGERRADFVDARLASIDALRVPGAYDQRVAGMAFFHMMERVRGRSDTVMLVRRLLAEPYRAVFAEETGGSVGSLLPRVRDEWRKWREENLSDLEALSAAVTTARGGKFREGLESVEAIIRADPRGALAPVASWIRARLLPSRDGDEEAVEAHRALRRDHPAAMTVQLYSRLDEALLLLGLGEKEAAADLAREVRRDWAWWVPGAAEAAAGILRKAAEPAGKGR